MTSISSPYEGLDTADGHLRPIAARPLIVPARVDVDSDRLVWEDEVRGQRQRTVSVPGDLLERFVQLAEAPGSHIAAFARRYGVLKLCQHDLPITHNRHRPGPLLPREAAQRLLTRGVPLEAIADLIGPSDTSCWPRRVAPRAAVFWEPLAAWRRFSRHAGALLRIAASLHQNHPAPAPLWQTIYDRDPAHAARLRPSLSGERHHLAGLINEWLTLGDVRPVTQWAANGATIALGGHTLFGALAVQLAFATCRADGFATCCACGTPYVPTRRPAPGRRTYCPACREEGRPVRDAKRDARARHVPR